MRKLRYYEPAMQETYDTYRDLHSIFNDPVCQEKGCTERSTILIDSESRKCQLWLDNTLISEPYTKEDACHLPSPLEAESVVRTKEWHQAYMQDLTDQVLSVVESCGDDVPSYLRENRSARYAPLVILPKLDPE